MDTAAVRGPVAVGLNVTLIVQLLPAATELPQVFVWVKSPGFVPVTAMLVMLSVPVPVLVRVTDFVEPLFPTFTLPQFKLVVDKLTAGAETVNDTPLLDTPLTVTTTLPVVAPVGTGATIEVALQLVGVATVPLKVTVLLP